MVKLHGLNVGATITWPIDRQLVRREKELKPREASAISLARLPRLFPHDVDRRNDYKHGYNSHEYANEFRQYGKNEVKHIRIVMIVRLFGGKKR